MAKQIFGNPATVLQVLEAFFGVAPSNAVYTDNLAFLASNGDFVYSNAIANNFSGLSNGVLANRVLTNLGITTATVNPTAYSALLSALGEAYAAFPTARGQVTLNLTTILTTLEGNPTYGSAASVFNDVITASATYSSNPANTQSADIQAPAGNTRTFTTTDQVDTFAGGVGNDTFRSTAGNLQAFDTLNGGAGTDTLNLLDNAPVFDAQFQNVSQIETLTAVNNLTLGVLASAAGINSVVLGGTQQNIDLTGFATALGLTGTVTAESVTLDLRDAGAKSLNLAGGTVVDTVTVNGAFNDVRVTFVSAEVGNGNTNDISNAAPQDALLAVRLQQENGLGNLVSTDPVHRLDDEGTRLLGATFDVRDLTSGIARGRFGEVVLGTAGAETLTSIAAPGTSVYINAGAGNDTLVGTASDDFLVGGTGDDAINAVTGNDSVLAGAGNDLVQAGSGVVSVSGGDGNDTIRIASLTANLTAGTSDTVDGGAGIDTLVANAADLVAIGAPVTPAVATITGFENLTVTTALGGDLNVANIQAGIETVNLNGLTGAARTVTLESGTRTINLQAANTQQLSVASTGTRTDDRININNDAGNVNVFSNQILAISGTETVVLNGTSNTAVTQTLSAVNGSASATQLVLTGSNTFEIGAITALSVDASGLTGGGVLSQTAAAVGVASITGSNTNAGDTLRGQASASTTIQGGAGNDTIFGGSARDSIVAGTGDDVIVTSLGGDMVDAGDGNDFVDVVSSASLAGATVSGGSGTDTLNLQQEVVAAGQLSNVTGFETVGLSNSQNVSIFTANQAFTRVDLMAARNIAVTGANNNITTLGLFNTGFGNAHSFSRLGNILGILPAVNFNTNNNSLTLVNDLGAAVSASTLTVLDEENLTVDTTAAAGNDIQIANLVVRDLRNLTVTGSNNVDITLVNAASFNNFTAQGSLGTVKLDASSSNAGLRAIGSLNGANTLVGGSGSDEINGGTANDSLTGGAGDDTIVGGQGNDTLVGGIGNDLLNGGDGADSLDGGDGNDRMVASAGDSVVGGAGTDTVVLNGNRADFIVTDTQTAILLTDPTGGVVRLIKTVGVNTTENIQFNDQLVAVSTLVSVTPPPSGKTDVVVATGSEPANVAPIVATAAAENFTFNVSAALADAGSTNTQRTISGFATGTAPTSDLLTLDFPTANPAITTLAQLNGTQGVTVQFNPFANATLINFGNDANGGQPVTITLVGVSDAAAVAVAVI